ncbi:MAG: 2-oxo acid dehydrogenase subunit E2 [Bdellovibrionota bacterium]
MGRIELSRLEDASPFRKVAMGTWKTAKDPSVYGYVEIDLQPTLDVLPQYCAKEGLKVTPSHLVGRAAAICLSKRPEINAMIRGNRIWLRKHVNIFYQVNIPGEGDDKIKKATLSGVLIKNTEEMNAAQIATALYNKSDDVRKGKDKELKKNLEVFKALPWWFSRYYLNMASFLIYGLNWNLKWLGIPEDPFGSVMITNIGSLGIDIAWAPLCPYTRVPLLLTIGAVQEKPWVVDGQVTVRPILPIAVTFDHRLIDGIHASQMASDFKECFKHPEKYLF